MDSLVTPSRTVSIVDVKYVLDGSFGTLRAVQEAFKKDIYQLRADLFEFRVDEVAKLIAIATGRPKSADDIGQAIVDEMDVCSGNFNSPYMELKSELFAWLVVCTSSKPEREKKSAEVQAMLSALKARSSSLGTNTSGSPSVSSDGSQASSGGATSGS
jgi:hypothetical protein